MTDQAMDISGDQLPIVDQPIDYAPVSPANANSDQTTPTEYSSENYKICIHNLPRYMDAKGLKKFLTKLQLDVRKAYTVRDHGYACFTDESTVVRALELLQNYTLKKNVLRVKRAAAAVDPILAKKKRSEISEAGESSINDLPPEEQLLNAVTPLHKTPYVDQLSSKQSETERLLKQISRQIRSVVDGYPIMPSCGYIGELKPILASPAVDGYRNKCEFSIGYDHERRPTVGFRLTRYKAGSTDIVSPQNCPHLPDVTKNIVAVFQRFIVDSGLDPFDVTKKTGFWSMLTVRQFLMDTMVIVTVYKRDIDQERLEAAKRSLVELFSSAATLESGYRLTSLYFQQFENTSDPANYEHLWGAPYIYENLLGLRFRISPGAFFQVNTAACEVLYKAISDACKLDPETLVLDFCCGTGTIGIVLAGTAAKVVGIESCTEAVYDAKINAKNNERQNCEFIDGKVENVIDQIRQQMNGPWAQYKRVVGILDPPRNGLPMKALTTMRQFAAMKTMVYVSCDPNGATKNFLDLTRRTSNRFPGEAFQLKTVQPVDMFPHTKHCEWILVFER